MSVPARYVSPDGVLVFEIVRDGADIILGFENFPWHTHPDLLSGRGFGDSEQSAVENFVEDLLRNKLIVAVYRRGNEVHDIEIVDDPDQSRRYVPENVTVEFRHWDASVEVS